jgi:hypothetical protein
MGVEGPEQQFGGIARVQRGVENRAEIGPEVQ